MIRRSLTMIVTVFAVVLASLLVVVPAQAEEAARPAQVYIIHGIPGRDLGLKRNRLPVDIAVNDVCTLTNFKFRQVVGPVELPEGTYNIKISLANKKHPCSNAPVIEADVPFAAGESATVIAHLSEAGAPTASKFVNDLTPAASAENGVVVARHTAAVPTVDLLVSLEGSDEVLATIAGVSNGAQARAELPVYTKFSVGFAPAGTTTVVASATIEACEDEIAIYHAVGSLTNKTFTIIPLYIPIPQH